MDAFTVFGANTGVTQAAPVAMHAPRPRVPKITELFQKAAAAGAAVSDPRNAAAGARFRNLPTATDDAISGTKACPPANRETLHGSPSSMPRPYPNANALSASRGEDHGIIGLSARGPRGQSLPPHPGVDSHDLRADRGEDHGNVSTCERAHPAAMSSSNSGGNPGEVGDAVTHGPPASGQGVMQGGQADDRQLRTPSSNTSEGLRQASTSRGWDWNRQCPAISETDVEAQPGTGLTAEPPLATGVFAEPGPISSRRLGWSTQRGAPRADQCGGTPWTLSEPTKPATFHARDLPSRAGLESSGAVGQTPQARETDSWDFLDESGGDALPAGVAGVPPGLRHSGSTFGTPAAGRHLGTQVRIEGTQRQEQRVAEMADFGEGTAVTEGSIARSDTRLSPEFGNVRDGEMGNFRDENLNHVSRPLEGGAIVGRIGVSVVRRPAPGGAAPSFLSEKVREISSGVGGATPSGSRMHQEDAGDREDLSGEIRQCEVHVAVVVDQIDGRGAEGGECGVPPTQSGDTCMLRGQGAATSRGVDESVSEGNGRSDACRGGGAEGEGAEDRQRGVESVGREAGALGHGDTEVGVMVEAQDAAGADPLLAGVDVEEQKRIMRDIWVTSKLGRGDGKRGSPGGARLGGASAAKRGRRRSEGRQLRISNLLMRKSPR